MIRRIAIWALLAPLAFFTSGAWAAPNEKRITVAPGVSLRVIEAGKMNKGLPIVFIPGWSTGADIWRDQIDHFGSKHRIVSFDPRSQGRSTKTLDGNTPEQRAADLHELLTRENVRRPVLVGWSQAAQDVAAYVLKYGTKDISGIALVDAAVSDGAAGIAERPKEAAFQFDLFGTYLSDQRAYLRGMFRAIISKPQPAGFIDRTVATAIETPASIGMSMLISDMFTVDRRAALAKMDCPVLIIASGKSFELDRQKDEAKAIRSAQFVQIDDASHAVFLDQPDRFAAVLAAFLEGLDKRRQ